MCRRLAAGVCKFFKVVQTPEKNEDHLVSSWVAYAFAFDDQVVLVEASGWREVETALSVVSLPPASEETICRVVAGTVEVPRLERWRAELVQDGAISVRIGGRYVITGGSGGLGTACAQWLLNQGAGSLITSFPKAPGHM